MYIDDVTLYELHKLIIIYFIYLEYGQEQSELLSDESADNVLKKIEGLVKK